MAGPISARRNHEDDASVEEVPILEEFIGYNLKRAYMIVQTDFRRAVGDEGLAPRVFSALALVVQFPNITQSGLARGAEPRGLDRDSRDFPADRGAAVQAGGLPPDAVGQARAQARLAPRQ